MRILMLGNSFTFYHGMPRLLAALTDAEVVAHTRGGAHLAEHLNAETELGARTLAALRDEKWDYVVMQEQSSGPVRSPEAFLSSSASLCRLIRENGATPVFYATWSYRDGSKKLASTEMSYEEMADALTGMYHRAAQENDALVADVGTVFRKLTCGALRDVSVADPCGRVDLLEADDYHPSTAGSTLAAEILSRVILEHSRH